ncbi:MAG: hypothetical protein NXH74_06650 [Rhodobacteraceae bacterium]|nr:hypothetical protein [Paracoccaceae bacterium]
MKKFTTLASAALLAIAGSMPAFAQSTANSDPFVSSQASVPAFLTIGGVGGIVVTTVIVAIVVAIADSSSSSTT